MKRKYKMIYEETWRYTCDDWCPNYQDDKIKISLIYGSHITEENKEDKIKIVAQGADDYGLEIILWGDKFTVNTCQDFIKNIPEIVNQKYFKERMFLHI